MIIVEMFEHQDYNNGEVEADKDGLWITTEVGIGDFRDILIDGVNIKGVQFGRAIAPGTRVNFNDMMSSYRISGLGPGNWVEFFRDISFGGASLDVPPESSSKSNLGGTWWDAITGGNWFNDQCSSLMINGPREETPVVESLDLAPSVVPMGGSTRLFVNLTYAPRRRPVTVYIELGSDGARDSIMPLLSYIEFPIGVRSVVIPLTTHPQFPRATYVDIVARTTQDCIAGTYQAIRLKIT